ncbi:unnamed protein product [Ranitomeya imitator]|uniref:Metalloendopeptidase n=1 Tax=Ranitomeya imitator TaxID=111125 RepID=A0ABN9L1F2_9NEOB|nr:unnamed protein product [Ranitomeya imitator]
MPVSSADSRVADWAVKARDIWDRSQDAIRASKEKMRSSADAHRRPTPTFAPGDLVWLSAHNIGLRVESTKFAPRFLGPFKVLEQVNPVVYRLALLPRLGITKTFHVSLLKPAYMSRFSESSAGTSGLSMDDYEPNEKNSIIGEQYRWPIPVPYYLEDSLDINAKALVLEAFERYRLKSCIEFKPWEGEANYISVFKESGCWSYIGNRRTGKQQLSLGNNCDRIATIQHEFLHALGFWHEQSRSDRDDYVIIMWDRIQSQSASNFNKYDDSRSSNLNVPYDYTSVMHYGKTAFQIGTDPTIVTRIDAFSDVIGQRMDFSDSDLEKLNRLYNCSTFITFLDTCDFEYNNICGMIQGTEDNGDWQHVRQMPNGPSTDHTNLGDCRDVGYFMHFDTRTLTNGEKALLKSRLFYPKRDFQCLEFFYYHNGHESDQLNVLIREYTEASPNGTLKFITTVKGQPAEYWQLYHVSISTKNKFRVVFEGVKGIGASAGGISVDDINFSEAKCPHHIWHIRNFTNQLSNLSQEIYSPPYYSKDGYAFQVQLSANADNLEIYFHLISGENDNKLQWPCSLRQATMTLMDQNPDIRKRMSNLRSITTDPNRLTDGDKYFWDKPELVGSSVSFDNGTQFFRGPGLGTTAYITHERVRSRDFLKGGDAFLLLSVDGEMNNDNI